MHIVKVPAGFHHRSRQVGPDVPALQALHLETRVPIAAIP
jgi:hypothetical protein